MAEPATVDRTVLVRRGRRVEYFTIGWNLLEGGAATAAGAMAGSISLVGFGVDSFIEVASGMALLWRMSVDADVHHGERNERLALRIVGLCFVVLALYIAYEGIRDLVRRQAPEHSIIGIVVASAALVVMPILSRSKRAVGSALDSRAMHADAAQTDFCAYLSAILICGLLLNMLLGWWWADPAAALIMVPIIGREGMEALQARRCREC